jgi:hypothetical protein
MMILIKMLHEYDVKALTALCRHNISCLVNTFSYSLQGWKYLVKLHECQLSNRTLSLRTAVYIAPMGSMVMYDEVGSISREAL